MVALPWLGEGGVYQAAQRGQTQHSLSWSLFWHEVGAAAPPRPAARPVKTILPESRPRSQGRTFQSPWASGLWGLALASPCGGGWGPWQTDTMGSPDGWIFLMPFTSLLGSLGSRIWTNIDNDGSKTRLTCALNHSATEIVGHRWVKGGKVLKEDALPDLKTEYE